MVRKCRALAKIALMEVDVRTTRPPPVLDDAVPPNSANKRKIPAGGTDFQIISTASTTTSFLKLRSQRRRLLLPENNSLPTLQPKTTSADQQDRSSACANSTSDDIDASASCCSEVVEESVVEFVDLEDEKDEHEVAYKSSRESLRLQSQQISTRHSSSRRRETTPSSQFRSTQSGDDMESPAGKSEATSSHRSLSSLGIGKIMPAESDLEEFFIAAEKNIQKRFTEKYNYDIVEDIPLEGRYEWVRLKP